MTDGRWLDRLQVRAVRGSLFDVAADAIALPVRAGLVAHGALCDELAAAQPGFEAVLQAERYECPSFAVGDTVVLDGCAVGLAHVEDVVVVGLWDAEGDDAGPSAPRAYASALRTAFVLDARTLAVPLLGADDGSAIVAMLRAFDAAKSSRTFPVETLTFVSPDDAAVARLATVLERDL